MPVLPPRTVMSAATASICATTKLGRDAWTPVTPRVFWAVSAVIARGAVDAVRGERLEVGLNAGAAARVAARDCQCCDHTLEFRHVCRLPAAPGTFMDASLVTPAATATLDAAQARRPTLFVTALTAAAAQISVPLPFTPVPFTFQPMIVLLGGAVLGPAARDGEPDALSRRWPGGPAGVRLFARAAAGRRAPAGADRRLSMAYPLAALATGSLAARGFDRRYLTSVLAMAAGLAVVFFGGVHLAHAFLLRAPALVRCRRPSPPGSIRSCSPIASRSASPRRCMPGSVAAPATHVERTSHLRLATANPPELQRRRKPRSA